MKVKVAMTVLKNEMEFLGMNFNELLKFIEKNPLAVSNKTLKAYKIFNEK